MVKDLLRVFLLLDALLAKGDKSSICPGYRSEVSFLIDCFALLMSSICPELARSAINNK
jgi:hypothetical protein